MHSTGRDAASPGLRSSITFLYDGFTRPLVSELMSKLARGGSTVFLSEFSDLEKKKEVDNALGDGTKILFTSFDRHAGSVSKVSQLQAYALELAIKRDIRCVVHVDLLRTLARPPFDDERIRLNVALIVLAEAENEDNCRDVLKRVAFPNITYVVHAPGATQASIKTIVTRINQLTK